MNADEFAKLKAHVMATLMAGRGFYHDEGSIAAIEQTANMILNKCGIAHPDEAVQ